MKNSFIITRNLVNLPEQVESLWFNLSLAVEVLRPAASLTLKPVFI